MLCIHEYLIEKNTIRNLLLYAIIIAYKSNYSPIPILMALMGAAGYIGLSSVSKLGSLPPLRTYL
ncbi:hypothetical protein C4F40_19470 [Sphingobacterium sp. Ka21]|uniref:Uncharacterized protein n=1 Tax=Sphingobacterium pedocola TaxID=2082722 RepID=A0ABR9TC26_9SPHI|nr:hypothetical protein [Sphingobacterium pedocola]